MKLALITKTSTAATNWQIKNRRTFTYYCAQYDVDAGLLHIWGVINMTYISITPQTAYYTFNSHINALNYETNMKVETLVLASRASFWTPKPLKSTPQDTQIF